MAKVKGLKKLNKIINEFTKENFGVKAKLGSEFLAYPQIQTINYAIASSTEDINFFITDAIAKYPHIQADPFLWLLLHEIGHCQTDAIFTEEESEYFNNRKEELEYIQDDQLRNDYYHCLPDEFLATRWAANYMINHQKKLTKFWKNKLQPALIDFYTKNSVDIKGEMQNEQNA